MFQIYKNYALKFIHLFSKGLLDFAQSKFPSQEIIYLDVEKVKKI